MASRDRYDDSKLEQIAKVKSRKTARRKARRNKKSNLTWK